MTAPAEPGEALGPAELVTDDRERREGGVEHLVLELGVALEDEAEDRRGQQQQREDRDEGVVGHRRREVVALVVEELVEDREREAKG